MINPGIENLINWINLNSIIEWKIANSREKQANNFIFKSNEDSPLESEIQRMREVLALSENQVLYIQGTAKKGNTGGFSDTWQNINPNKPGIQSVAGTPSPAMDHDLFETKIQAAIDANNLKWQRAQFERELKEFKEEKREYEKEKSGIVGMLVEKAAPFVGTFMQKMKPQVAGLNDPSFQAEPMQVRQVTDVTTDEEFTDEESERLFALVSSWKKKDADYITLLEKIVNFATSEEPIDFMGMPFSYEKVKEMLIKL